MAALTADRDTLEKASGYSQRVGEVAASSTQFYKGGILVLDQADGKVKKGATGTGLIAIGRSEENLLTGASNTRRINARDGIYLYGNSSAGDAITSANIGSDCFIVDDQTVALTSGSGTRSRAGKIFGLHSDGSVWVAFTFPLAT